MNAFECLRRLHKEELYESVAYLGSLVLTACERRPDSLSAQNKYQAHVYYADALYQLEQYKKAERVYRHALQLRRNVQTKNPSEVRRNGAADALSEPEVIYRLHLCLLRQKKLQEAVGALENIPVIKRTAKMKAALASLYKEMGKPKEAADSYNDLFRECPYALDAVVELLGVARAQPDVPDRLRAVLAGGGEGVAKLDWFPDWFAAQQQMATQDYASAVSSLEEIDAKSSVGGNTLILTDLARAHYFAGEASKATGVLQRVQATDPLNLSGTEILAALLYEERKTKDLELLAVRLMGDHPQAAEPWLVFGYLCRAQEKHSKALYFAHKASSAGKFGVRVEGMILKGRVLLDLDKSAEAVQHFQEALASETNRFEIYEGLVKAYLRQEKTKEALRAAKMCVHYMGQTTARPLLLFASALAKENAAGSKEEAVKVLERAVATSPALLDAVYMLVELYKELKKYEKAVELLRAQTGQHVSSKLHKLLGDCLSETGRKMEALDSYRFALSLDPGDEASAEALQNMDILLVNNIVSPEGGAAASSTPSGLAAFATHLANAPARPHRTRGTRLHSQPSSASALPGELTFS